MKSHKAKKIRKVKRKVKRAKTIKKRILKKVLKIKKRPETGKVIHFYDKIKVGVFKLKKPLSLGDVIEIEGHGKKFTQKVASMQINMKPIKSVKAGQEVAIKVAREIKKGDTVYKV